MPVHNYHTWGQIHKKAAINHVVLLSSEHKMQQLTIEQYKYGLVITHVPVCMYVSRVHKSVGEEHVTAYAGCGWAKS